MHGTLSSRGGAAHMSEPPTRKRRASTVGVSTACGAVLSRGIIVIVPEVLDL